MDITNKTNGALSVPLAGGKKLFLGPGKTGQVSSKALERPQLKKMIEAGDLELAEGSSNSTETGSGSSGPASSSSNTGKWTTRQSGDR